MENILINYKLDAQALSEISNAALNAAFNSPEEFCPTIIGSQTTRDNIYYLMVDDIKELHSKYDKYRTQIDYIANNLDGKDGTVAIIGDKCAAVGYSI